MPGAIRARVSCARASALGQTDSSSSSRMTEWALPRRSSHGAVAHVTLDCPACSSEQAARVASFLLLAHRPVARLCASNSRLMPHTLAEAPGALRTAGLGAAACLPDECGIPDVILTGAWGYGETLSHLGRGIVPSGYPPGVGLMKVVARPQSMWGSTSRSDPRRSAPKAVTPRHQTCHDPLGSEVEGRHARRRAQRTEGELQSYP